MQLSNIIKQSIDIHVHLGPEIIPRKYTVDSFIKAEEGKLGGAVFKNHFYPTTPLIASAKKTKLQLFGGIVLNNAVGGLNTEALYASSLITDKPVMVWFPTINAEQFLNNSTYEIAPEWVQQKNFSSRKAKTVTPVVVTKDGKVTTQTIEILKAIKKYNFVLATGHISWKESEILVTQAKELSIKKIVITHPIYQRITMPVEMQQKLAGMGAFIEQCYSMYAIDKISIKKIAEQIKEVGVNAVILSSDVGQAYSPSSSEALRIFAKLLQKEGMTDQELFTMLVKNPKKLLGID